MAWLFDMGYLEQPHTSAGRVPSHMGYREYIDALMQCQPLTDEEKKNIESLFNVRNPDTEKLLENATDALSEFTGATAITSSVTPADVRVKRIELIPAGRSRVIIVLRGTTGVVRDKICRVNFIVTPELCEFFVKFINSRLAGRAINAVTAGYINSVSVTLGEYAPVFNDLIFAVYDLCKEISEGNYYVSGGTKLLDYNNAGKSAKELLELLENRNDLLALFGSDGAQIKILIGKENSYMELAGSALVTAGYEIGGRRAGSVGLIGPVRLNYAKVIPHLEYFAKTLGELLSETYNDDE
jgi:heat-inducible transcriptional repressor